MRKWLLLLFFVMNLCFFQACTVSVNELGCKKEVTEFSQETFEISDRLNLYIDSDSSNVEVYSWDKQQVKIEMRKRVRGIGDNKELQKKLKDFSIELDNEGDTINYKSQYKKEIKNVADTSVDLRLFVPKRVENIDISLEVGTVKFLDDIKSLLNIDINAVNVELKRFEGKIVFKGDMGNLKIENGKIERDSKVSVNLGNINIKAEYEEGGTYTFKTHTGNIQLLLPENSGVNFELQGTSELDDFPQGDFPTKIYAFTDMGKILIKKY